MANINRTYKLDLLEMTPSDELETEISNIVNTWNYHDIGTQSWTTVKVANFGSNKLIQSSSGALAEAAAITASRALASDTNGIPVASATTATELGFVNGVTSAIQTQINAKQATLTAGQLPGTATNDSASAGNVGQYIESTVAAVSGPANNTWSDLTSISLTAGDWDVSALVVFNDNSAVLTSTDLDTGISTTSGNSSTGLTLGVNQAAFTGAGSVLGTSGRVTLHVPVYRVSISTTTIHYLKQFINGLSSGTPNYSGRISARRVR